MFVDLTVIILQFTAIENESRWHRAIWQVQRCWTWLHGDTLSPFFRHDRYDDLIADGYLLLEYMMEGHMLSSTWKEHRHDEVRRKNLYRGMSNILLDLAKVPQARIGSWTMNGRGIISLTNRPLIDFSMLWARHQIPTGVPRVSRFFHATHATY